MEFFMKRLACILTFLLCSSLCARPLLTVPFRNVRLDPGATLAASYSFGKYPIIFCYENTASYVGVMTWPYQGQLESTFLPVQLKLNKNFQGNFADPSGTISITNNVSRFLIVSCQYGL
jgi:hypothetical protein